MKFLSIKVLSVLLVICLVIMVILFYLDLKLTDQPFNADDLQEYIKTEDNNKPGVILTKQSNSTIHICTTVDEHHILGFIAMVSSVWKNTKQPVLFHVLCSVNMEKHIRTWLHEPALRAIEYELRVFQVDKIKKNIAVQDDRPFYPNAMAIASFYYTEYFPNLHGRVIHLDSDIIVQGDIQELFRVEIGRHHMIALSEDCMSPSKRFTSYPPIYNSFINFQNSHISALKMKPTTCSFNAGVYVFNADMWRHHNITGQLKRLTELNSKSDVYGLEKGGGQTAPPMMIVFYKNYSKIKDPMWNIKYLGLGTSQHLSDAFVKRGKLLHWSGPHKPWTALAQYKQLWEKYHVPDPLHIYKPTKRVNVM